MKRKFDADSDNVIVRDEFTPKQEGADGYFDRLDRNLDGKISAADFDVSVFSAEHPSAARSRWAELLFRQWDSDSNGQVTANELNDFFTRADREASSFLTVEDLLGALDGPEAPRPAAGERGPSIPEQLRMFFGGQFGWFEEGPKVGEAAPDFSLDRLDGSGKFRLSESREKRPVVLIFGSFT